MQSCVIEIKSVQKKNKIKQAYLCGGHNAGVQLLFAKLEETSRILACVASVFVEQRAKKRGFRTRSLADLLSLSGFSFS